MRLFSDDFDRISDLSNWAIYDPVQGAGGYFPLIDYKLTARGDEGYGFKLCCPVSSSRRIVEADVVATGNFALLILGEANHYDASENEHVVDARYALIVRDTGMQVVKSISDAQQTTLATLTRTFTPGRYAVANLGDGFVRVYIDHREVIAAAAMVTEDLPYSGVVLGVADDGSDSTIDNFAVYDSNWDSILPVFDWTHAHRDTYRYIRVDYATRAELEELRTVQPGGTITRNINTTLKESGSLPCGGPIDIGDDLVRIYFDAIDDETDAAETVVLATMHATAENVQYSAATATSTLTLYSALLTLEQATIDATLTVPAGTVAVSKAAEIITGLGLPVVADPSSATTTADASWDPGTSKLGIVNDLLGVVGFWSARPDGWGRVILLEYTDPSDRQSMWDFTAGPRCIFLPDLAYTSDRFSVPNKCTVICSQAEGEPIAGVAVNDDSVSPYSTVSRGREIPLTATVSDIADQAAADALAKQKLVAASAASETVTVKHSYAPVTIGDVAHLTWGTRGLDFDGTVQSEDVSLTPGALTISNIKRIWR